MGLFQRRLAFQNLETRRLLAAVDIPADLSGSAGQVVVAPVNVDNASGIRGAEIRLSYNTAVLDLLPADVAAGTVWAGATDTQVTANVDDAAGTVVVFIASSSPLSGISGSLVNLRFTIQGGANAGATAVLDLTEVTLNEGQITTNPAPAPGPDATDGLITIGTGNGTGTHRVGGFVYADTNNNSIPNPNEGIAGVLISIVNQAGGEQRQATTAADGSYQFLDLPVGTYTVTQQQPNAYLDGGNNALTVTVVAGSPNENQNFRELGLRPEFVYNRLLSTTVRPIGSQPWIDVVTRINVDAQNVTPISSASLERNVPASTPSVALAAPNRTTGQTVFAAAEPLPEATAPATRRESPLTQPWAPSQRDPFGAEPVDRVFADGNLF